jgi:3-phosphoshikimate 1-carboxyvinyltransferase
MILKVTPVLSLKGSINLPASKSYSIRAAMIAACGGTSLIKNLSDCDDALVAIRTAASLGAKVSRIQKGQYKVSAANTSFIFSKINVKESGTVLRFLLPLLSLSGQTGTVMGEGTLRGRPNLFLTRTLRDMGVEVKGQGPKESIPIQFQGGTLKGGKISIDGSLSSQFISALLITCPQLEDDTHLTVKGKRLVSKDYIDMTLNVLKKAGVRVRPKGEREFLIKGGQKFSGLKNFTVPSDYGLAAFMLAAAAIVKSDVTLLGHLKDDLVQADGHIIPLLKKMGVRFTKTSRSIKVKGPFALKGGDFSLESCPDLVPIMSVLALFAEGRTRLRDIQHARAKESDRISDLRKELVKVGAKISEKENELIIDPVKEYKRDCTLDPHNDHRLAMAFAVLGLRTGIRINNIECSHKSYPGFVKDFSSLGARVRKTH